MTRTLALSTALAIVTAVGSAQAAVVLTFDDHLFGGTASGTISHAAGGVMTGTGIDINGVAANGAPLNNGVANALRCDDCTFSFTSGALTQEGAPNGSDEWVWGAGGSFSLVGTLVNTFGTADTTDDVQIGAAGATLLSGSFTDAGASGLIGASGGHLDVHGFGVDTKNADMLAYFGLAADTTWELASTHISSASTTFGSDGSFTAGVTNTDLNNAQVVPEPASLALLGMGVIGLGAFSRRRKAT